MNQNNNADCRICGKLIRGFDDICLSCWTGIENATQPFIGGRFISGNELAKVWQGKTERRAA